jgi:tetratricopeptide (TPR) repeat protein
MIWILAAVVVVILLFVFINSPKRLAVALTRTAAHHRERKDWTGAAKFYSQALQTAGLLKDPLKSKLQSQIEILLAMVLHRQGKMREAGDLYRQGYSKVTAESRQEQVLVCQGYLCWGDLCTDEGRYHEGEIHYRQALEGDEKMGNIAGTVFDLQCLADSLIRQDKRVEAEEIIHRAIAVETKVVHEQLLRQGKNPAEHSVISMSVPDLHFCREQYEDTRRLYREKVAFWETQVTRPDNIDLGHLQMRLALAEARTGHRAEALEMYTRAESTFRREWCEEHPKALAARAAKDALVEDVAQAFVPAVSTFVSRLSR